MTEHTSSTTAPAPSGARPAGGPSLFAPAPGAAPMWRMVGAQAGMELRVMLRHGEQFLLTMVIPVLLLVGFSLTSVLDVGEGSRVDALTPGVLALAIMSTSFTGLAIGTGFERRYGVLKRLGATPLSRFGLLAAKTLAVLGVQTIQIAVLCAVALGLGWNPTLSLGGVAAAIALVLLATAAFSSLALLMAGTLRAEATLAAANLVYILLLGLGGVLFPITAFPSALATVASALPITALSSGLRALLTDGSPPSLGAFAVLTVWALVCGVLAARLFRWE
ncbi:ABC transporter permease [Nocardiopsis lambiniae]|uniref:ABC transporter permease n=1 Tax=Nocardiopsis lambiniae TaxID=3075539 RepID=A0ABU2ME35_9ACTN|nr:ABC transporter permease [Nocardiopsis sp. DSM 44743]MDT0330395.1 ABC transporter permease [Nocardiopsis sp. DSM 44743]